MKILAFLGPQEIIILMIVIYLGFYIFLLFKVIKWIRNAGGGVGLKTTKWIIIVFTFLLSFFLISLNVPPLITLLIIISSVGAIIGIAKFRPNRGITDKPTIRKQDV